MEFFRTGFKIIRRRKQFNDIEEVFAKLTNVGIKVHPKIKSLILEQMGGKIRFNYGQINVVDVCPVLQCYRCQGFKHKTNDCEQQHHTCAHCAGDHYLSACPNKSLPAKCVNCMRSAEFKLMYPGANVTLIPLVLTFFKIRNHKTKKFDSHNTNQRIWFDPSRNLNLINNTCLRNRDYNI